MASKEKIYKLPQVRIDEELNNKLEALREEMGISSKGRLIRILLYTVFDEPHKLRKEEALYEARGFAKLVLARLSKRLREILPDLVEDELAEIDAEVDR